jgi:hypothetical protein
MAQIEAAPPIHSLLDIEFLLTSGRAVPPLITGATGVALLLVRSILLAVVLGYALAAMTTRGDQRSWIRAALRGMPGVLPGMLALEVVFLAAVYILSRVFTVLLGPLAPILGLVLPAYYLIYAPVVLVSERVGAGQAVRLGLRASRVPGRSHLSLTGMYSVGSLLLLYFTTGGPAVPATPSITVWCYALFLSFVHTSVLGAFAYRWLLLRQPVLEDVAATPRRERRAGRT